MGEFHWYTFDQCGRVVRYDLGRGAVSLELGCSVPFARRLALVQSNGGRGLSGRLGY